MRQSTKYVGLDVHQTTAVASVREGVRAAVELLGLGGGAQQGPEFPKAVALAVDVDDGDVMAEPVEDGSGQDLIPGKDLRPVPDVLVGGQDDAPRS